MMVRALTAIFLSAAALDYTVDLGLGTHDVQRHMRNAFDPHPFAPVHHADRIDRACAADGPFLIIDAFSARQPDFGFGPAEHHEIDIDGDLVPDVHHGDLVEVIARQVSGKNTISYGLLPTAEGRFNFTTDNIRYALENIISLINSGDMEKPAAIILSMGGYVALHQLAIELGLDENLSPDNAASFIHEIQQELAIRLLLENPTEHHIMNAFKQLSDMSIPVITGAGNSFSQEEANIFSLMGAIPVGSLTHDGFKVTDYTNDNSLTVTYRIGDYIGRNVNGGIDINNDGLADFANSIMSGEATIAESLGGVEAPLPTDRADDLFRWTYESYYGQIKIKIAGEEFPFRIINGTLAFDPANTGDPSQVSLLNGTSLAAPAICGPEPHAPVS